MLSKTVTDYLKSARELVTTLRTHRKTVSERLKNTLGPHVGKGETLPDGGFLLELFARHVEQEAQNLENADRLNNQELADDPEARRRRDEAAETLRSTLLEIKQALSALYGPEVLSSFSLPSEVSNDPTAIARIGSEVKEALGKKSLPKPVLSGVKVDVGPWSAKLAKPLKKLETALRDVSREAAEAKATQVEKNRALLAFEDAFGASAAAGRGMLIAAGETEHAERISLSPRRGSGSGGGGDEEGGDEGESGAGEEGSGSPA